MNTDAQCWGEVLIDVETHALQVTRTFELEMKLGSLNRTDNALSARLFEYKVPLENCSTKLDEEQLKFISFERVLGVEHE